MYKHMRINDESLQNNAENAQCFWIHVLQQSHCDVALQGLLHNNCDNFLTLFDVNSVHDFLTVSLRDLVRLFLGMLLTLFVLSGFTMWSSIETIMVVLLNTMMVSGLNTCRSLSGTLAVVTIFIVMLFIFIHNF